MLRKVLGFSLCLILISCGQSNGSDQPIKAVVDCRTDAIAYKLDILPLVEEWDDAIKVADAAARIALPPQISQLQEIKRKASALQVPSCAEASHQYLVQSMESSINGFIAFMGQENDTLVTTHFLTAQQEMTKFDNELTKATTGIDISLTPTVTPDREALLTLDTKGLQDLLWQSSDEVLVNNMTSDTSFTGVIDGASLEIVNESNVKFGNASIALFNTDDEATTVVMNLAKEAGSAELLKGLGDVTYMTIGEPGGDYFLLARCNVTVKVMVVQSYANKASKYIQAIDQRIQAKCGQ